MRLLALLVFLLFADAPDVLLVAALRHHLTRWLVVIAFVQTQVLRSLLRGGGAFHDDGIQRRRQQQVVVYVCPCDANRKRAASLLDQQALLDAQLGTVGGVGADPFALRPALGAGFGVTLFPFRCLARSALAPFLPMKRALFMQPSAACHSQWTASNSSQW